ncbi:MAG TPA: sigma-70 family RNA polymerase sigma factor [Acidimicrobiia bacterium]|nr:sigma-70 family RNA polymerase sigma factor [Acidimicrobiia bacterium]
MAGSAREVGAQTSADVAATELHSATPAGFDALFDAHFARAVRLAWLLAPGDQGGAEDAAADAIARVWPKWAKGRVEEFWPYLRLAVVNQVRGRGRRLAIARRYEPIVGGAATRADDFELAIVDRALLTDALHALPDRQRTAVVLRFYEDLSEAECARVMGCSLGTVKSTTSRGLAALRALLETSRDD